MVLSVFGNGLCFWKSGCSSEVFMWTSRLARTCVLRNMVVSVVFRLKFFLA